MKKVLTELEKTERTLRILECAFESPNLTPTDRKYVKSEVVRTTENILKLKQPNMEKSEPKTAKILPNNLQQNLTKTDSVLGQNSVENYGQNWNKNGDKI